MVFCVSMRGRKEERSYKIKAKDHKEAFQWGKIQAKQLGHWWMVVSVEAAKALADGKKLELN